MFNDKELELMVSLLEYCRPNPTDPRAPETQATINGLLGKFRAMRLTIPVGAR